ncbi:hypothetical protein D3C86_915570 [compost metagenome]
MYCCVSICRIEQIPISGRQLRHERKGGVAQQANFGHGPDGFQVEEAIALCVIGLTREDRVNELGHEAGVHLAIAVNLHYDLRAIVQRSLVSGHHGAANALVFLVIHHLDPGILHVALNELPRSIRAAIVHNIDRRDFRTDEGNHTQDVRSDLVTRDNDRYVRCEIH